MKGGKEIKQWVLKRTKSGKSTTSEQSGSVDTSSSSGGGGAPPTPRMEYVADSSGRNQPAPLQKVMFNIEKTKTPFYIDKRYVFDKALGGGAYGIVCSAKDVKTGKRVAIKKIAGLFDDLTDAKRILREVRLLRSMNHENVLRIVDIDQPEDYARFDDLYIVLELMDTDMAKLLRSNLRLEESQRCYFTYQILKAMKYIHSGSILHRDLKPANIIINENCDLKVCDFGLARYTDPNIEDAKMTEYVVTRWYRAPELLLSNGKYTAAIDMWSVGCIVAELYTKHAIFPGKDVRNQIRKIVEVIGRPKDADLDWVKNKSANTWLKTLNVNPIGLETILNRGGQKVGPEALDFISRLLRFDPKERMTAEQALAHPYVKQFRQEATETVAQGNISAFDLEPPSEVELGAAGIRRLIWDEMLKFRPEARAFEPAAAQAALKHVESIQESKMKD